MPLNVRRSRLKKRGRQKTHSKGSKKAKGEPKKLTKDQEKLARGTSIMVSKPKQRDEGEKSMKPSSSGSVIVDKVNVALDAFNSRVTPLNEIPKKTSRIF